MLKANVTIHDTPVAEVKIENVKMHEDGTADYSVMFLVDRGGGTIGAHRRFVHCFPRKQFNALALLRQALMTLDEKELELEHGDGAADLAREVRGIGDALSRKAADSVRDS